MSVHARIIVGALLIVAIGCGPSPDPSATTGLAVRPETDGAPAPFDPLRYYAAAPEVFAHVYPCDDAFRFVAEYHEVLDVFRVRLPDREIVLAHERSGSGAKYGDGETTYWSKGDEATLTLPDGTTHTCVEDKRASILESARLRGATHRGTGNQPQWIVEVGEKQIVFVRDYGRSMSTFLQVNVGSKADGATEWTTTSGDRDITVSFRDEPCEDTMAGEVWPMTVHVDFDGTLYEGCGSATEP